MKKYLFLICLLFPLSLKAENFVDALGAECSRVLHSLSGYDYPKRFDTMLRRNRQFDFLQTCIQLYKENGGQMDILNDRYYKAQMIYRTSMSKCLSQKTKEENVCSERAEYAMDQTFLGRECDLKTDNDIYNVNGLLDLIFCKDD